MKRDNARIVPTARFNATLAVQDSDEQLFAWFQGPGPAPGI